MEQVLKDNRGHILGRLNETSLEIVLNDEYGRRLGVYNKRENATYDAHGHRVGSGNLLGTLIKK